MTAIPRTAAVAALALLFVLPARAARPSQGSPHQDRWLGAMFSWLAAVNTHKAGQIDATIGTTYAATLAELRATLEDVMSLRDRLASSRSPRVSYRGRQFGVGELRAAFGLTGDEPIAAGVNHLLRRAAVYHADMAIWTSQERPRGIPRPPGASAVLIGDGRQRAETTSTLHWDFGRELLDRLTPGPRHDELARAWYSAAAGYLEAAHMVSDADRHLQRAREIFPDDAQMLFEGGRAIEALTSPSLQAALHESSRLPRTIEALPGARTLLGRAEALYRRALLIDATLVEARIRLARVTIALGERGDSIDQLRQALAGRPADDLRYLALMTLGDAEQAAGRRGAARDSYEEASRLYPTAQSPLLALGVLAREGRDREAAASTLERLARFPPEAGKRVDPWWAYYQAMQGRDARQRLAKLYEMIEQEAR